MKKGDILLVKYKYDLMAWFIRRMTNSNWNHACWVIDDCHILEVKRGKLQNHHIRKYSNKKLYETKLVRIKNLKKEYLKLAIDYGLTLLKQGNYFAWVWSFILILFNYKGVLPGRTCSGFIAESLSVIDYYFRKDKSPDYITPGDIENGKKVYNVSNDLPI